MKAPVVSRRTKLFAALVAAPFVILVIGGLAAWGWGALPGFFFFTGLVIVPIALGVWLATRGGRRADALLKGRLARMPTVPPALNAVEDAHFELTSIDLPLFSRPLANLWTRVGIIQYEGISLRVFDLVHADMLGEGSMSRTAAGSDRPGVASGMSVVSCALALVEADMPLVVVRPRREKQFTLPAGMREYTTELGRFNRAFQLFSEDAYAATAIVDQRTIEAIGQFDPGTAIEIGGPAVLVYTSRRGSFLRLIQQAAGLARTFPRIVSSLYPPQSKRTANRSPNRSL